MREIKLWVDDMRRPPSKDWIWCRTTNSVIDLLEEVNFYGDNISVLLDLDHDAGDYEKYGGDYIKILDWIEETDLSNLNLSFHLHSMNPVGMMNMRDIIEKNGWALS